MFSWYGLALYENLCRCTLFHYRFRVLLTLADSRNLTLALYGLLAVSVACPRRRYLGYGGMWNLFDALLVLVSILDTVLNNMSINGTSDLAAARMVRLVRFVRLIRLARAVRAIHSLRLFISSIVASGISLIWC